jgi:hypothetical protein
LIQYLKKGYWVAAKNVKCLLNKINVVMFQHIMNTPMEIPIIAALIEFTLPKYSGAKNKALAPKVFMKLPLTMAKSIYQKTSITWYFLKWRKTSCTGNE